MSESEQARRLALAVDIAHRAGERIMQFFSQDVAVQRKDDNSPVTVADREAERFLRGEIEAAFPEDGIIGEELDNKPGQNHWRWIVDPIDGTKSFISGVPLFSTLVAVQYEKRSVVGVIELPGLNRRVYAAMGMGAQSQVGNEDPKPAQVARATRLCDGLYVTSEVKTFAERNALSVHQQLEEAAWYARTWGDGYGYYLVATGRALAMVDPSMSIWDAAALLPIVVEAGGQFTDWQGHQSVESGEAVATNGRVHEQVLSITRQHARNESAGNSAL